MKKLRYETEQGEVSLGEMKRALEREIKLRRYVYWKKVRDGQMSVREAEREVRVMEAVLELVREQDEPRLL